MKYEARNMKTGIGVFWRILIIVAVVALAMSGILPLVEATNVQAATIIAMAIIDCRNSMIPNRESIYACSGRTAANEFYGRAEVGAVNHKLDCTSRRTGADFSSEGY